MDSTSSGAGGSETTPSTMAISSDGAGSTEAAPPPSRYESQKRRDWNTFQQYLKSHKPPLSLNRCSGAHVIEFLKYLDQFGKTKVHVTSCPYFGQPNPPAACACVLKQAWGSLDALIGRLRAAYEEDGGRRESNPFGAKAVRIYLREVRESQVKARDKTVPRDISMHSGDCILRYMTISRLMADESMPDGISHVTTLMEGADNGTLFTISTLI
ncbi:hypothetical protein BUALT_Bualt02G0071200 [Buddleja alternifolia]|uniref:ALOG domain-containing protein n=1 Tax=Buddleja alternifolia TaxID=168488 RepID=A0AAV6Y6Q0_9LAMI|nr:hypothetical protein BUALT_Bualt02G0071200 [Buddleja alternifolia]